MKAPTKSRNLLFLLTIISAVVLIVSNSASAEIRRRTNLSQGDVKKLQREYAKKYPVGCAPGSEVVGELPPGGNSMWCEHNTLKGKLAHGTFYKWNKTGALKTQGNYFRGRKHGTWSYYRLDGKKQSEEEWFDGKRVTTDKFDDKGKKLPPKDETTRQQRRERVRVPAVIR